MTVFAIILLIAVFIVIPTAFLLVPALFADNKKAIQDAMDVWAKNRKKAEWVRVEPIDAPDQWECLVTLRAEGYTFEARGEEYAANNERFVTRLTCITPKGDRLLLLG